MIKRRQTQAIAAAFGVACFAPSPFALQNPLPQQIARAKTVYVDNETGKDIAGVLVRKKLMEWGRFQVVASASAADLLLTLSGRQDRRSAGYIENGVRNEAHDAHCEATLTIYDPSTHESVWAETRGCSFRGAFVDLIQDLKKKMGQ